MLGIVGQVLNLLGDAVQIGIGASKGQAGNAVGSTIVSIIISLIILGYLNRANVKAYLGRA